MAQHGYINGLLGLLLRVFALGSFVIGIGFIAFGCTLESPPKTFVPGALVAIGCFAILSSAVGYAGAHFRPFFLMLYLIVGTVSTTLQLLIVLGIFGAQDRVADEILAADSSSGVQHFDRSYVMEKLTVGKWIFLWVVLAEGVSLGLAVVMRSRGELHGRYENMEQEEVDRHRAIEIQNIGGSLSPEQKSPPATAGFGRLAGKMKKKYGQHANANFYEGQRGWLSIFNR